MSTADRAAELRAQADALEQLAELEQQLLEAKHLYATDPTSENRAVKQLCARQVRQARELARMGRADLVGGDAFVDNGTES